MSAHASFTFILHSTDSFGDCWQPFLALLKRFWPEFSGPVLLNTESGSASFDGLDVRPTLVGRQFPNRKPSWSEMLLACLDEIETPAVILLLDDFFPAGRVDDAGVARAARYVLDGVAGCVALTEHGRQRALVPTADPFLCRIDPRSPYLMSTSPAVWSRSFLQSVVRPSENAWQFEVFGSRRSRRKGLPFHALTPALTLGGSEGAFPYFQGRFDTGIVKGKWQPEIRQFFEQEDLQIDYDTRGFYEPLPGVLDKWRTARKLLGHPVATFRGLTGY